MTGVRMPVWKNANELKPGDRIELNFEILTVVEVGWGGASDTLLVRDRRTGETTTLSSFDGRYRLAEPNQ